MSYKYQHRSVLFRIPMWCTCHYYTSPNSPEVELCLFFWGFKQIQSYVSSWTLKLTADTLMGVKIKICHENQRSAHANGALKPPLSRASINSGGVMVYVRLRPHRLFPKLKPNRGLLQRRWTDKGISILTRCGFKTTALLLGFEPKLHSD